MTANPFQTGDKVRENRLGAKTETVSSAQDCMVYTYSGGTYHWTKLVRVNQE